MMVSHQTAAPMGKSVHENNLIRMAEIHKETNPEVEMIYQIRYHSDGTEECVAAYVKGRFLGKVRHHPLLLSSHFQNIYSKMNSRDSEHGFLTSFSTSALRINKGGFARCYEMRDISTGKIYAGKIVDKSTIVKPRAAQKLRTEIKIHRSLHHKSIVGFEKYFEDEKNVYILLEMCNHKVRIELPLSSFHSFSLHHKRKRFSLLKNLEKFSSFFSEFLIDFVSTFPRSNRCL